QQPPPPVRWWEELPSLATPSTAEYWHMGDMAIRLRKMTSRSFRGVNRGTVMTTAPFLQRRIQTGGILQTRARGCRTRPRNASPLPYRAPFRRLLTMRKGPKERPDAALYSDTIGTDRFTGDNSVTRSTSFGRDWGACGRSAPRHSPTERERSSCYRQPAEGAR